MGFRFVRDPLFLASVVLYAVNRWIVKPYAPNQLSSAYVNDVLCIPIFVPLTLLLMWVVRLRDDAPPRPAEVLVPLLVWSYTFEVLLPTTTAFMGMAFADPFDFLAYTIGACFAGVYWKLAYPRRSPASPLQS